MKGLKFGIKLILSLFVLATVNAYADSWSCSNDNLVREVVVDYPEGGTLPCTVIYKKQTEGFEDQALWNASSQEGYCEEKAKEFVAKLGSWGWVCMETIANHSGESM